METNYTNLFSTQPLDRLEEIYQATMDVMDDSTLQAYCMTAKYNKNLCNDNFWLRRIKENNLELLLPYRSLYPNLMTFYFNARKDACYIVANFDIYSEEDAYAFNDINLAMSYFVKLVNYEKNGVFEDTELDYSDLTSDYQIFILFNNVVLSEQTVLPYTIYNLKSDSQSYLNPNIAGYPLLSHDRDVLYYMKREPQGLTQIGILSFSSDSLRLIPQVSAMYYLFTDPIEFDPPARWYKAEYAISYYTNDLRNFLLVDTSILNNSSRAILNYPNINDLNKESYRLVVVPLNWRDIRPMIGDIRQMIGDIRPTAKNISPDSLYKSYKEKYERGEMLEDTPEALVVRYLLTTYKSEPLSELRRLMQYL